MREQTDGQEDRGAGTRGRGDAREGGISTREGDHQHIWRMPHTHYRQCWLCGVVIEGEAAWEMLVAETKVLIGALESGL